MKGREFTQAGTRAGAERGLTLVELLVTIALSALFFAALVPVFVMASQQGQTDRARVLATNAAQSTIETLRDLPYDDLYAVFKGELAVEDIVVDPQWKGSGSGLDIGVTPYPYPTSASDKGLERYLLVSVRAWWTRQGGGLRDVTLETAVYRQGLGTRTLLLYAYPIAGDRITSTPVTVTARLDAADWLLTQRIDFEVWANNGTSIANWSVYSDQARGTPYARLDDDGYYYYEQPWEALGVPDGTYSFLAKAVPLDSSDPNYDPNYQGDRARKQYVLDRVPPGKPTIGYCRAGFQLAAPDAPPTDVHPSVSLAWTLPQNISDVASVELSRAGVAADGSALASKTIPILSKSATAYVDRDVEVGTSYTYRVMVKDAADQQGEWSDPASCAIPGPTEASIPDPPASQVAARVDGRSVILEWAASPDDVELTEYRVYRDTGLAVPIHSEPAVGSASAGTYSYQDPTVEYGGTYSYFVTAVVYDGARDLYWESAPRSGGPVQIPEPPVLSMRISIAVGTLPPGAAKPSYAKVAIHSMDTGALIPAYLWEYPTLTFVGNQREWDTAERNPLKADLFEGDYEVIAMFYSQKHERLGTYTEFVRLTARDTPVVVTYGGLN